MKAFALFALLAACSRHEPRTVTPATRADFAKRCAPCHGETGRGDGPAVVKLPSKPPDFADAGWQKSVTDDEIKQAIVRGGVSLGKSPAMPALRDLEGTAELEELVVMIRNASDERGR